MNLHQMIEKVWKLDENSAFAQLCSPHLGGRAAVPEKCNLNLSYLSSAHLIFIFSFAYLDLLSFQI